MCILDYNIIDTEFVLDINKHLMKITHCKINFGFISKNVYCIVKRLDNRTFL